MKNLKHLKHLRSLRLEEIKLIKDFIPTSNYVLEIGAGTGWQTQALSKMGYAIEAIDVEQSNYTEHRVWKVKDYDGKNIPFPDNTFDAVFSSNVLEHIRHLEDFQLEIKRVLKPNGLVVHVLPTTAWRVWTCCSHYLYLIKFIIEAIRGKRIQKQGKEKIENYEKRYEKEKYIRHIFPARHGVRGSLISEFYYFSSIYWCLFFRKTNWTIWSVIPNRLFYTGHNIFGDKLTLQLRKIFSFILGSSCKIYVLKNLQ